MKRIKQFVVFALLAVLPLAVFAADGDLDLTFDTDGKVTTDFNNADDAASAVAIQADGKIVVAGSIDDIFLFGVARYNTDGSLDTTFDTDGKVSISPGFDSRARAVAIQPDGKIVVVGVTGALNDTSFAAVRFNANGSLDTAFGSAGIVLTRFSGINHSANAVAIQADGKIVVAGLSADISDFRSFALARYNANGTLDASFDGDGKVTTAFAPSAEANAVFVQGDGRITAAGRGNLARYSSTGALDPSFGTGGRVLINNLSITSAKVQSDGKIVVAGITVVSGTSNFAAARVNPNGFLDSTFGTGGRVATNFGTLDTANALVIQADGKIVVAGGSVVGGSATDDFAVVRYNANGTLDASFGSGGKVTTNITQSDLASGMALQADGKIVVAGLARSGLGSSNFAVVRYRSSGSARRQFDFDGDGRDDFGVFRPFPGTWFLQRSTAGFLAFRWGLSTDKLAPADFDGDGKTDIAVWRDEPTDPNRANFYIFNSSNNTVRISQFGRTNDDPDAVGDWDGDGVADLAVFRQGPFTGAQAHYFYRPSSQPGVSFVTVPWGVGGDFPVRGDFDGDGKRDAAIVRPGNNTWFIRRSSDGSTQTARWGIVGSDNFLDGDFDGDGKTDLAVYRLSAGTSTWFVLRSSDNQPVFQPWGLAQDKLTPGDYDGDGRTDFAVWRPSDGIFYVLQSGTGALNAFPFGSQDEQDFPIANAYIEN